MNSPIKWVGGKRKEIKYFEKYIPNFDIYVEPFIGGEALYWYLEPEKAVINDINENLINFYQVLRDEYSNLSNGVKTYLNNKDFFNSVVNKLNNKEYQNNIEQAEIFYYLNKTAFSGKWRVNSRGKKPCEEAKLINCIINNYSINNQNRWCVELSTTEDIINFINKNGKIVIDESDVYDIPKIEIYDSWRE